MHTEKYSPKGGNGKSPRDRTEEEIYAEMNPGGLENPLDSAEILRKGDEADIAAGFKPAGVDYSKTHTADPDKTPDADTASISEWGVPVDIFSESVVPPFPLDALPHSFQVFANEMSASSGFDAGAYGFDLLIAASGAIDQTTKAMISGSWESPAFLWGGKVAQSGGGKTPVMKAATAFITEVDRKRVMASAGDYARWKAACDRAGRKKDWPKKPNWKQRIVNDATSEAVGELATNNPDGLILIQDELTEFIGRMDAYSGNASGKDRGAYMRAFEGGEHLINRKSSSPLVIDNFSACLIGGIQPEKLGQLFKHKGGGSDGLYQRFLLYKMAKPGAVNLTSEVSLMAKESVNRIFELLDNTGRPYSWLTSSRLNTLSENATHAMQEYINNIRIIVARTTSKRFAEHLDKFPSFLIRIALTLHLINNVVMGRVVDNETAFGDHLGNDDLDDDDDDSDYAEAPLSNLIDNEIFGKALKIMRVLYRHSEAVYADIDAVDTKTHDLVESAGEAILSQGWRTFKRGDMTARATHWRSAGNREKEDAIDHLIELNWILDVTPLRLPGQRGRPSDGVFSVNPAVFNLYKEHSERIKEMRSERHAAILAEAAERRKP